MASKTNVDDINRNIYDIKDKDNYEFKMQKGLSREIVEEISVFHRNMYLINRTQIAEKLLKRMGNANIDNWQKDFQK